MKRASKLYTLTLPFLPGVVIQKNHLYIAAVALLALIVFIIICAASRKNKKDKKPANGKKASSAEIVPPSFIMNNEDEVFRGIEKETGLAIIARYKRSYMSRLIQASDETKVYYSLIKNAILSYGKVSTRISWGHESVNAGRTKLAKLVVRGKTLHLYLALDPDSLDSKYRVTRAEAVKYADTPCAYKINGERRARYALELVDMISVRTGLERQARDEVDYRMPYESTEALVAKGLIKELVSKENYEEFLRKKSAEEIDKNHRSFVSAAEVNSIISDEVAELIIEDKHTTDKYSGKKTIINIDTLSENFESGDVITLDRLKEKALVGRSVGYVKVLARGVLDKPLTVELQGYSIEAVKMIALTGGRVERV